MCHQRGTTTAPETTLEEAKTQPPWHRDPENLRNLSKSSLRDGSGGDLRSECLYMPGSRGVSGQLEKTGHHRSRAFLLPPVVTA
jgi:hypothetical protein